MKRLFTLIILINFLIGHSQENPKTNENIFLGTCETGSEKAKTDFKNGIYNIFLTGLSVSLESEEEFYKFYDNYMLEKYNIRFVDKGCVVTESLKCYKETMRKLVFEKFGEDIFEKSKREAKEKFEKK